MVKELTENQQELVWLLENKSMTRVEMRRLGVNPRRADLRQLERKGIINASEKYDGKTRYFEYSINR